MNNNLLTTISNKVTSGKVLDVTEDELTMLERASTILDVYKNNLKLMLTEQQNLGGKVVASNREWKVVDRVTYKAEDISKVTETFIKIEKKIDTKAVKAFKELNNRLPSHIVEVRTASLTSKGI